MPAAHREEYRGTRTIPAPGCAICAPGAQTTQDRRHSPSRRWEDQRQAAPNPAARTEVGSFGSARRLNRIAANNSYGFLQSRRVDFVPEAAEYRSTMLKIVRIGDSHNR